jgi:DnaJ-class molecular chaperone
MLQFSLSLPMREMIPLQAQRLHVGGEVSAPQELKQAANGGGASEKGQMKKPSVKPTEHECPACNGTGFPVVMQPVQPDRKIYPVQCVSCSGKGRITEAAT